MQETLDAADENLEGACGPDRRERAAEETVADKGYHSNDA